MLFNNTYNEIIQSVGKTLGNIIEFIAKFTIVNCILFVLFCVIVVVLLFSINGKLKEIIYELKFGRGK